MTSPEDISGKQDIVQIVKELGNRSDYQELVWLQEWGEHYPEVAQALLIAMEALEKHETKTCQCCADLDAQEALSRIRSLPPSA